MLIENKNVTHQIAAKMAANKLGLLTSIINEPEIFKGFNCASDLGRYLNHLFNLL